MKYVNTDCIRMFNRNSDVRTFVKKSKRVERWAQRGAT